MYEWITHTGNTIKGQCPHDCSYCYMKRWGNQHEFHLDEKELETPTPEGNFIFVGSSCDMFAKDIPEDWIIKTLNHCNEFNNRYLFQSKNPERINENDLPDNSVICTTIETNRVYSEIMRNAPDPVDRAIKFSRLPFEEKYITIEPIMDFDTDELFEMIVICKPKQVNIGADSGGNKLPEPSIEKIMVLIKMLEPFTTVKRKKNLARLLRT